MATYRKWTDNEVEYIRANYLTTPDEVVAADLSTITSTEVTTAMVRRQRRKLKLDKPRGRPTKNKQVVAEAASSSLNNNV